jgi:N-acetylmuramoyl-L-alanine amidase
MRKIGALILALGCLTAGIANASVTVEGIRVSAQDASTRVVLDLDATAEHNVFTLRQPNRVVIDLRNGRLDDTVTALPENIGFVRSVRVGKRGERDLRIVIDLSQAVQASSFFAGPVANRGDRLVIDLGERRAPTAVKRAPADESQARDLVVVVDPGHGGRDPGAIGSRKTREKDVVLAISRKLVNRLNAEPGMRAFLTRDKDVLVPHRERMEQARRAGADLFISVHADAVEDPRARGSSVYALSLKGASDEAAKRLAERENAHLIGGVSLDTEPVLASVLMDLSQNASIGASIEVGDHVIAELGRIGRLHRNTVQTAGFMVLKSPDVPSILVETAYISNPQEERNLASPAHQDKLANAIFLGVRSYFYSNPPADTVVARLVRERAEAEPRTYRIARGDTLSAIAERYRVSLRELRSQNRLGSDKIRVGQVITIPSGG